MATIQAFRRGDVYYVNDNTKSKRHMFIIVNKNRFSDNIIFGFTITSNRYNIIERPVPIEVNDKTSFIDPTFMKRMYADQLKKVNYVGSVDDTSLLDLLSEMYILSFGGVCDEKKVMNDYRDYFVTYFKSHPDLDTMNKEGFKPSDYIAAYSESEEPSVHVTVEKKTEVIKVGVHTNNICSDSNRSYDELNNLAHEKYEGIGVMRWSEDDQYKFLELTENNTKLAMEIMGMSRNSVYTYRSKLTKLLMKD